MANKEFHELITAEELSSSDVIAEQRNNSGTWLTRKLTFNALGLFLLDKLDYATELHTTSKKIIGAINELKDGVSAVTIGTTVPSDSQGDNRTLYIQYDGNDYSVVAMYVKIEDSWRPIELGGGGSFVELTQAEYDALEQAGELEEDTLYFITDVNGDGSQFQPVIFSTTEREIGVWTNGKPLYEKTIITNSSVTNADVDVDISNLNVDLIIYIGGEYSRKVNNLELYYPWGENEYNTGDEIVFGSYCRFYKTNDSITYKIIHKDNSTTDYQRFTIRYTKSTDTAGSGTWTPQGVPAVHYSTDERIVGTWIDGSTLYERTIEYSHTTQGAQTVSLPTGVVWSNIKNIVAIVKNETDVQSTYIFDATNHFSVRANSTDGIIVTMGSSYPAVPATVTITIRYTKSST